MLCPLQFPSEASFLNNKLSHSLDYNRTFEGKKCGYTEHGYTGISHIKAKGKQATYLLSSVEGRAKEGERKRRPNEKLVRDPILCTPSFLSCLPKKFFRRCRTYVRALFSYAGCDSTSSPCRKSPVLSGPYN